MAETVAALKARIAELEARELPIEDQIKQIKERVTTVAKKYAERHGWCEVVDQALIEMGMGRTYKRVTVEVTLPSTVTLDVDADEFAALTEEQQASLIRGHTNMQPVVNGSGQRTGPVRVLRSNPGTPVIGAATEAAAAQAGQAVAPTGYTALYTSASGRVMHLFRELDINHGERRPYATCGVRARRADLSDTSPRGTGNICARCQRT